MASRYDQLNKLAMQAGEQLNALRDTLEAMEELREAVQDWFDTMNENWQQGEAGQKAEAIGALDFDPGSVLSEVESALSDLEATL